MPPPASFDAIAALHLPPPARAQFVKLSTVEDTPPNNTVDVVGALACLLVGRPPAAAAAAACCCLFSCVQHCMPCSS